MENVDSVPQTSSLRIKKLCCMCSKTMKQWSRWSLKGESPTLRHVSRTHRVALDWLFDRINLDPKIQIKIHYTPKTNSQTYWPREISQVMNGNIFCVCLNISHFSSTECSEVMSKRTQKRFRWRKGHSKIETDDEFGLAMQRKDSWRATLLLHQKARRKPDTKVYLLWACKLRSILERGDPLYTHTSSYSEWNVDKNLVFSRVDIWWIDGR